MYGFVLVKDVIFTAISIEFLEDNSFSLAIGSELDIVLVGQYLTFHEVSSDFGLVSLIFSITPVLFKGYFIVIFGLQFQPLFK